MGGVSRLEDTPDQPLLSWLLMCSLTSLLRISAFNPSSPETLGPALDLAHWIKSSNSTLSGWRDGWMLIVWVTGTGMLFVCSIKGRVILIFRFKISASIKAFSVRI